MALPKVLRITHSTDNVTIINDDQIVTVKDIAINGNKNDLASTRGQIGPTKELGDNIDYNTITESGFYLINAPGSVNAPFEGNAFFLQVFNSQKYTLNKNIFQIAYNYSSARERVFIRQYRKASTDWSAWSEIILSSRLGDGITVNNGIISVPEMAGATTLTDGVSGLVPPPLKSDLGKTLGADGDWTYPTDIVIDGNIEDLASVRGQIGNAKEMPNLDFNTLITPGNYRVTGNPTNGPSSALNIPGASIGSLIVTGIPGQNGHIFQIMISDSTITYRTILTSTEKTWSAWKQLFSGNKVGDGIRVTNGIISVPEYEGATASTDGTSGLVPPAVAGEQNNFLTGGGEYKSALSTAGGELTGSIGIVDVNNVANIAPSADTEHGFYVEDKNKFVMGGFDFLQRKSHNNDKLVQMFSKNSQGNYHVISVATAEDGTGQATITCPTYIAGAVTNLSGTYVSSATERYRNSALEIRENNYVSNTQTDIGYAPSIGFHWGNTTNGTLVLKSDGAFAFINGSGARATVNANVPYASESGTSTKWNGAAKTVSTAAPSGGANGDIWFQY